MKKAFKLRKPGLLGSPFKILILNFIAWIVGVLWITPFIGIFMTSIRPFREVVIYGWWAFTPFTFTLKNYIDALFNPMFSLGKGILNSFIIAIPSTLIPVSIAALTAYGFARFSLPVKKYLFATILFLMAVPQQMTIIPIFFLLRNLHLLNTYLGLILVHSSWGIPWITFFLRNYFSLLPVELEEAARVDGATDFQVFRKVVLPLALPGIISASVLQFAWVWNDFFFALMLIFDPNKMVVTQMLPRLKGQYQVDWGLLSSGSVIAMLAPLLIYALFNRYYMRGFRGWAMKR
ncbi:MAG: ABC transporter permease [Desulfurococcales archaeon ex4484_217_2]|nr:MAG: ABC transporter permease [Desulfurococcales archaeon ex4484_217_2]